VAAELARALSDVATGIQGGVVFAAEGDEAPQIAVGAVLRKAEDLARRAVAATEDSDAEARADTAHALGAVLSVRGELEEARVWLERSLELAARTDARLLLARARAGLFHTHGRPTDRLQARRLLEAVAADAGAPREAFEAEHFRAYWEAQIGHPVLAADASVRALALRERLRRAQFAEIAQRAWLFEVGRLPSQAAYRLSATGRREEAVAMLEAGLFTELVDRFGDHRPAPQPSFASVARHAAVEPIAYLIVTEQGGLALIVAGERVVAVELPALTADAMHHRLLAHVVTYRAWLKTQSSDGLERWKQELEDTAAWLWTAVMSRVLEALPDGANALTVVTDGVLGLLPLHAARGDGPAVIDRIQLRIAPNAAALEAARAIAATPPGAAGVVAAVPAVPDEVPLPFAAAELHAVAAIAPDTTRLVGEQATVPAVSSLLGGRRFVHLACHGFMNAQDPGLSAIVLAGGEPLTLVQVMRLGLSGTRLVVLSACESGMTEIGVQEEKASLPSGFLLAGAAGVVASLWSVDDRSTMLLVVRMHELLAGGTEPAAALRAAQVWLRDTPPRHLHEWAQGHAAAMAAAGAPADDVARMAGAVDGLEGDDTFFTHPYHWAGFSYFGA
jgi:CHAT domain-containing protein